MFFYISRVLPKKENIHVIDVVRSGSVRVLHYSTIIFLLSVEPERCLYLYECAKTQITINSPCKKEYGIVALPSSSRMAPITVLDHKSVATVRVSSLFSFILVCKGQTRSGSEIRSRR